jgi:uncharacterized protein YfaT (DUF1175 family)
MESALALLDSNSEFLAQDVNGAVVWHLEVVDAGHDRREVVVGCVRRFAWFADDGEHGGEVFEAYSID